MQHENTDCRQTHRKNNKVNNAENRVRGYNRMQQGAVYNSQSESTLLRIYVSRRILKVYRMSMA